MLRTLRGPESRARPARPWSGRAALREAVFEVFDAIALGRHPVPQPSLERLNAALKDALPTCASTVARAGRPGPGPGSRTLVSRDTGRPPCAAGDLLNGARPARSVRERGVI